MRSVCKIGDVVVRNCFCAVRSNKSSEAARDIFDRVICVLLLIDKGGANLVEQLSPDILFELSVSLNVCSTTRCKLGAESVIDTLNWIISVSRRQDVVLDIVRFINDATRTLPTSSSVASSCAAFHSRSICFMRK
jgi:hypothetical protein